MRRPHQHTLNLAAAALCTVALLTGCASSVDGPTEFTVAEGAYAEAFDATREVLREFDFTIDRVDAAAGVITTTPHFSQGLFEPWDHTQTGFTQEWEDALNSQAREVRVRFAPQSGEPGTIEDLRAAAEPMVADVQVTLLRRHRTGRRLDSEDIASSSFYVDSDLRERGVVNYLVPIRRDAKLEARLAAKIAARLPQPSEED